ncbi:hypothetical protein CVT26_004127 [Gymnopilus dilepis]|uniref:Alpha/beta hydrolase fold-3 domain-containing protein n=1 Tax=Gymnopilus dilepis TaxID=231916 RepID=A0A409YVF0_9AGAR|nr:hypothetical protein CVT26_004127 [Gymnopilus dilepis]
MDHLELRKKLEQWEPELVKTLPPLPTGLVEEYITIPSSSSPKKLKIIRPSHPPATAPLILLFHGGGFRAGTIEQLTRPGREFAEAFGAVVVSASYLFIPEHPFPAPVEDAYDTLLWVARNAGEAFGVDVRREKGGRGRFVVGGVSAGASLAAVLAALAIERGDLSKEGVEITGSFLAIPRLVEKEILPSEYASLWTSREEYPNGGGEGFSAALTVKFLELTRSLLKPDVHSPLYSPINAPEEVLKQLPRTYIQVGGQDCLRDDGVVYERFLKDRGVEVRLDSHPNLGHGAYNVFAQKGDEDEQRLRDTTMEGMKWLLGL